MREELLNLLEKLRSDVEEDKSNYFFDGHRVPRVTEIIQRCIHENALMFWANSIGRKGISYNQFMTHAANIGTNCHNSIDKYLDNPEYAPLGIPQESRYAFMAFQQWFLDLSTRASVRVLYKEHTLTCPYYGGTFDGLYEINSKVYLVDYKTSNHIGYSYFLQLAAYIFMIETILGIKVNGCLILQLSKHDRTFSEYGLNFDIPEHRGYIEQCIDAFLSMVMWYYNLQMISKQYPNIVKRGPIV